MRPKDYFYFLNDSWARVLVVDESLDFHIKEIKTELKFIERIVVVNSKQTAADTVSYDDFVCCPPYFLDLALAGSDDSCFWLYSSGST